MERVADKNKSKEIKRLNVSLFSNEGCFCMGVFLWLVGVSSATSALAAMISYCLINMYYQIKNHDRKQDFIAWHADPKYKIPLLNDDEIRGIFLFLCGIMAIAFFCYFTGGFTALMIFALIYKVIELIVWTTVEILLRWY